MPLQCCSATGYDIRCLTYQDEASTSIKLIHFPNDASDLLTRIYNIAENEINLTEHLYISHRYIL